MTKQEKIANFDPSGTIKKNGHFMGLPFDENDASIVLLPVPWDATVFYGEGTATAAQNILEASFQLNLYDPDLPDAWQMGIYMRHIDLIWLNRNEELRHLVDSYIDFLENGGQPAHDRQMANALEEINEACFALKTWVYQETSLLLTKGKRAGIVGGEHSVVLGYLEALAQQYGNFGILQIDAQPNLWESYQGFTFSHASIFNNALKIKEVTKLVQVGIRDFSEEEANFTARSNSRVKVWYDQQIQDELYAGTSFKKLCKRIVSDLPQKVYISFDIAGLAPTLCPNTGNPVPGGLQFNEAIFLIKMLADSGREIIGFDLCETAGIGHEWEGNIAARILYKLCNLMGKSAGIQ
jgi:agmatinase